MTHSRTRRSEVTRWLPSHYITGIDLAATLEALVDHPEFSIGLGDTLGYVISVLEDTE